MSIFFVILGAVVIQFLAEVIYEKKWRQDLKVTIKFQEKPVFQGDEAELSETIENNKWLLLPMLQVAFHVHRNLSFEEEENTSVSDLTYKRDIFSVLFYQKIERKIPFHADKRGYYEIKQADILTRGLLLGKERYMTQATHSFLYVYPKPFHMREIEVPFQKIMGQVLTKRRIYEDPFSFRGLREYRPLDPMNKINWKASAKTGELMVNLLDSTSSCQVIILLDVEDETIWKFEEIHEAGISMAVSLAGQLLEKGISVGVLSNGKDRITKEEIVIPPGSGKGHLLKIYQNLARLDLKEAAVKFPVFLSGQNTFMEEIQSVPVLISKNQGKDLVSAMARITGQCHCAVWIATLHDDMEWKLPKMRQVDTIRWEVPK